MVTASGGFGDFYCPLGTWVGNVERMGRWGHYRCLFLDIQLYTCIHLNLNLKTPRPPPQQIYMFERWSLLLE